MLFEILRMDSKDFFSSIGVSSNHLPVNLVHDFIGLSDALHQMMQSMKRLDQRIVCSLGMDRTQFGWCKSDALCVVKIRKWGIIGFGPVPNGYTQGSDGRCCKDSRSN